MLDDPLGVQVVGGLILALLLGVLAKVRHWPSRLLGWVMRRLTAHMPAGRAVPRQTLRVVPESAQWGIHNPSLPDDPGQYEDSLLLIAHLWLTNVTDRPVQVAVVRFERRRWRTPNMRFTLSVQGAGKARAPTDGVGPDDMVKCTINGYVQPAPDFLVDDQPWTAKVVVTDQFGNKHSAPVEIGPRG